LRQSCGSLDLGTQLHKLPNIKRDWRYNATSRPRLIVDYSGSKGRQDGGSAPVNLREK
jgi:hypothetical protein